MGGSPGQFSGFDLDGVILSNSDCTDATCAQGLTGLNVLDYVAGTLFIPGTQRVPVDPKLFGTNATGTQVNNSVATLGLFDGNSTTAIPGAFGFVSMGDGGRLTFNLTSSVATSGLYLYIGEVGDNGEVAAGSITVSENTVPEPATLSLLAIGLIGANLAPRKRLARQRRMVRITD